MKRWLLIVFIFFCSLAWLDQTLCQDQWPSDSLTTTGIATIVEGDMVRAQTEALADAHKKALMQAVGMLLSFEHLESQFASLRESVFDRAPQYIQSYRVLYENTIGDCYHITIQSTIAFKELEEFLVGSQLLTPQVKLPRILLMMAQQKLRQNVYTCWWSFIDPTRELTPVDHLLRNKLQKKGFEVLDHIQLLQTVPLKKVYGCLEVKPEVINTLGAQFKADIALVGTIDAVLKSVSNDPQKKSVQITITAKAITIGEGTVVATLDTALTATEGDEETAQKVALEKASSLVAEKVGDQISSRWVKIHQGGTLITLRVSGISTYLAFTQLKNSLKKAIPEIQSLSQKSHSEHESLLEITSSLEAPLLAARLKSATFEGFTISVTHVSAEVIELQAISHEKTSGEESSTTHDRKKNHDKR